MQLGSPNFGIDAERFRSQRRALCRVCMDWSERRNHLAGALGAALLQRMIDRGLGEARSRLTPRDISALRRARAQRSARWNALSSEAQVATTPAVERRTLLTGLLFGAAGAVAFSGKAVIVKLSYRYGVDAITVIMYRMLFALPPFALLAWWTSRKAPPLTRHDWLVVFGLALQRLLPRKLPRLRRLAVHQRELRAPHSVSQSHDRAGAECLSVRQRAAARNGARSCSVMSACSSSSATI